MGESILAASLALQLVAAGLAIALIPLTRAALAWVLVALALVLMAGRRALTLQAALEGRVEVHVSTELVALFISVIMVTGVALIRPVFVRMRALAEEMRDSQARLRSELDQRRQLEAELVESKKMDAIGRLSGGIAHDFNNMLTIVVTSTERARAKVAKGVDPGHELDTIDGVANRAAELTAQLVAYARSQPISPTGFDLNALIQEVRELLQRMVREDVRLEIQLADRPVVVRADAGQITQVVMNLVSNATDAMPLGGQLTIRTGHAPVPGRERPDGVLSVRDDGTGMAAEVREHIFEPFFTTKPTGRGSGLGLSSAYGIVSRAGGRIEVESEQGSGSTFLVHLPGAELDARAPEAAPFRSCGGVERILIVEDETELAALLADALQSQGYAVATASSGDAAMMLLEGMQSSPDLIITDIVMPGMHGPELVRRARALHSGIRVLFITGYGERELEHLGAPGGPHLLRKPFTPQKLCARVREVLEQPHHAGA